MEELFVYSLLYSIGYEKYDEYREALDNLFCCTPEDEILLDLEGRDYKDAMLHLYQLMNEVSFDIIKFGGQLMSELKTVYEESDIIGFSEKMYDLWKLLPDKINNEEPESILALPMRSRFGYSSIIETRFFFVYQLSQRIMTCSLLRNSGMT